MAGWALRHVSAWLVPAPHDNLQKRSGSAAGLLRHKPDVALLGCGQVLQGDQSLQIRTQSAEPGKYRDAIQRRSRTVSDDLEEPPDAPLRLSLIAVSGDDGVVNWGGSGKRRN